MKKRIIGIVLVLTMTLGIVALAGCNTGEYSNLLFREGDEVHILLNTGETVELKFAELFKDYALNNKKIEMVSSDKSVFTVRGNKISAVGTGIAFAEATVIDMNTLQTVIIVNVYVVNPLKMTEVKTVQDLANISKDTSGAYILKSDIDLKDFGDWIPIANYSTEGNLIGDFRGIFINPDGYKIKNMIINSMANIPDSRSHDLGVGLFDSVSGAYIDGLILENIFIDTTEYIDRALSAGGICGYSISSVIRNCTVSGSVVSQKATGGITGTFSRGLIIGCTFKGDVENTSPDSFGGSGGIAGNGMESFKIIDCIVEAAIIGELYAGGILGHYGGLPSNYYKVEEEYIESCSFMGELNAPNNGEICGLIGFLS
mgnify:CR=1 FL=1